MALLVAKLMAGCGDQAGIGGVLLICWCDDYSIGIVNDVLIASNPVGSGVIDWCEMA